MFTTISNSLADTQATRQDSNDELALYSWKVLKAKRNIEKCIAQLDQQLIQPHLPYTQLHINRLVRNFIKLIDIADDLLFKVQRVQGSNQKSKVLDGLMVEYDLLLEMLTRQKQAFFFLKSENTISRKHSA